MASGDPSGPCGHGSRGRGDEAASWRRQESLSTADSSEGVRLAPQQPWKRPGADNSWRPCAGSSAEPHSNTSTPAWRTNTARPPPPPPPHVHSLNRQQLPNGQRVSGPSDNQHTRASADSAAGSWRNAARPAARADGTRESHQQRCSGAAALSSERWASSRGDTGGAHVGRIFGRPARGFSSQAGDGHGDGDPSDARDLGALADLVARRAGAWAAERNTSRLRAAFRCVFKLSGHGANDPSLTLAALSSLARAYAPLVPHLRDAASCVIPLWATAKALFSTPSHTNHPNSDPIFPGAQEPAGSLFPALTEPDNPVLPLIHALLDQVIHNDAAVLRHRAQGQDVCNALAACVLLAEHQVPNTHSRVRELQHLLVGVFVQLPGLNGQDISNALWAVGRLREVTREAPWQRHVAGLMQLAAARLREHLGPECDAAGQVEGCGLGGRHGQDGSNGEGEADGELEQLRMEWERGLELHRSGREDAVDGDCGNGCNVEEGRASAAGSQERGRGDRPMGRQAPGALGAMGGWEGTRGHVFSAQEVSSMLVGCARLCGCTSPRERWELLPLLAAAAGAAAPRMISQGLANSLHSLYVLGCEYGNVRLQEPVRQLAAAMQRVMEPGVWEGAGGGGVYAAKELSLSAYALASMGYVYDQEWFRSAAACAARPGAMRGAVAQNWSVLWHALALARHQPGAELLEAMVGGPGPGGGRGRGGGRGSEPCALELFHDSASAQACVNTLWALATLGQHHQRLVDVVAQRLRGLLELMYGSLYDNMYDSGPTIGREPQLGLYGTGAGHGEEPPRLVAQDVSRGLWALAVLGREQLVRHGGLVRGLLRLAASMWTGRGAGPWNFTPAALTQLWQAQVELESLRGEEQEEEEKVVGVEGPGAGAEWRTRGQEEGSGGEVAPGGSSRGGQGKRRLGLGSLAGVLEGVSCEARGSLRDAMRRATLARPPHVSELQSQVAAALRRMRERGVGSGGSAAGVGAGSTASACGNSGRAPPCGRGATPDYWEAAAGAASGRDGGSTGVVVCEGSGGAMQHGHGLDEVVLQLHDEWVVDSLACRVDVMVVVGCSREAAGQGVVGEGHGLRRVAVEVDGPYHFLQHGRSGRVRDGRTRLRDRQLGRVFGDSNVVPVPHWEWSGLQGREEEEERYLAGRLGLQAGSQA